MLTRQLSEDASLIAIPADHTFLTNPPPPLPEPDLTAAAGPPMPPLPPIPMGA